MSLRQFIEDRERLQQKAVDHLARRIGWHHLKLPPDVTCTYTVITRRPINDSNFKHVREELARLYETQEVIMEIKISSSISGYYVMHVTQDETVIGPNLPVLTRDVTVGELIAVMEAEK